MPDLRTQQDADSCKATSDGYRQSHLAKGADYDADFVEIPRRRLMWKIEQRILAKILDHYLPAQDVDHLDFACGTGRILAHLESRVARSTGVDISPTMLEVARTQAPLAQILEGDITESSLLGDSTFDLITAFRFFPNAESELRRVAMHQLASHLRPDGILIFNNHRASTFTRSRLARIISSGKRGNQGMTPLEAHRLVLCAGLEVVRTHHTTVVPESEGHPFRPRWLIEGLEDLGARLPISQLAGNHIYVCRLARRSDRNAPGKPSNDNLQGR